MAEMKTRAAAALTALGLACGGMAFTDGSAGAVSTAPGAASSEDGAVTTSSFKLVFSDNFNGNKLSKAWSFRNAQAPQRVCSKPDARMASVKNGKLLLRVQRDASRKPNVTNRCPNGQYLNGMIGTPNTTFSYGRFSARIKFHQPKGAHGAFWLQSPSTEVDTIEYFGRAGNKTGGLRSYVHRPKVVNGQTKFVTSGGPLKASKVRSIIGNHRISDGFHTFTVVWTPTSYVFSIDGKQTLKVTDAVSSSPVNLVLSLLSSDYELPALKSAKLPATMQVDWVKVWRRR
ncbi:glycoside hydrolase family 16 protein [Sporichthya sp.]|uniref:glycoside hydrolase family 16 protein n=1 Tax=Sporichthya sp. TaxID=65475 RepID=UPI0017CB6E6A|nr:glycoside hydrolase family 16 protein [Sporichthya sp.]MBA3744305.1 glycoside hydrolase family 16 protein [Sporichthya sp.]